MTSQTFTITPQGPFSLTEAATFGFGQRSDVGWDGVMRLAFCVDGYVDQVGVEVRQDDAGAVHCTIIGDGDLAAIRRQVARVLSLDHDGREFTKIAERDAVIARLQQAAPGLRPPLFYSPYEAAAWSVLSARRPAKQMMAVRQRAGFVRAAGHGQAGRGGPGRHQGRRFRVEVGEPVAGPAAGPGRRDGGRARGRRRGRGRGVRGRAARRRGAGQVASPQSRAGRKARAGRIARALAEMEAEAEAGEKAEREEQAAKTGTFRERKAAGQPTGRAPAGSEAGLAQEKVDAEIARQQARIDDWHARQAARAAAGQKKMTGPPPAPAAGYCRVREAEAERDAARDRDAARQAARDAQRATRSRNITDPDSRLMPVRGGGFIQGYNTQNVTSEDGLIIATEVTGTPGDVTWFEPMAAKAEAAAEYIAARQPPATTAPDTTSSDTTSTAAPGTSCACGTTAPGTGSTAAAPGTGSTGTAAPATSSSDSTGCTCGTCGRCLIRLFLTTRLQIRAQHDLPRTGPAHRRRQAPRPRTRRPRPRRPRRARRTRRPRHRRHGRTPQNPRRHHRLPPARPHRRNPLSEAHGTTFELAGQSLAAFPLPEALLAVESFPGIQAEKIERLQGVAKAALNGQLDADRLLELDPAEAMSQLLAIKGIGPFYSSLIVIRGTGFADVVPLGEPRALELTAKLYGLEEPVDEARFREVAEAWKPLRTWAIVLIRAASPRVLDAEVLIPAAV